MRSLCAKLKMSSREGTQNKRKEEKKMLKAKEARKLKNDFLDEEKALKAATKAFYTPDSFNGDKGDWVYGDKVKYFYDNDVFDKADDDFLSQFKSSALAFYESMAIEEVPQEIE